MKACPDDNWWVIFALARFGGMRTPSEVLNLAWEDVDWKQLRLRIDSPKTGFRTCPLFPELLPLLKAAWKANGGPVRQLTTAVSRLKLCPSKFPNVVAIHSS